MSRIAFIFGLLLGIVAASFCAWAQTAPQSQATSSIAGTVVDAITGQPLKSASVWARNFQPGAGGRHFASASTDAEGHFLLDGLVPGRYGVSASREDYVGQRRGGNGSGGKLIAVVADQHVDNVTLQLTPGAVVAGHVRDAAGKALTGVSVEVLRYFYDGGQKQLHGVRSATLTNTEGEYRITGLAPSRYYLRASSATTSETNNDSAGKSSGNPSSKEAYASAYYPGNSDLTRAVELVVLPGADLSGIDLTLPSVRTVDVSGRVLVAGNSTPAAKAEVNLVDADGASSFTRQCTADAKGNFQLHDVLPGNYVLLAEIEQPTKTSKVLFGSKAMTVGKANLSKVEVAVAPGSDVSGHIRLEDKANDKAKVDFTRISVELQPQGNSSVTALMPGVDNALVNADGSFVFSDVPQGTYQINFSPMLPGYYVKTTGAADVLETGISVSGGQPLAALDLTLSSKVARLEGDVSTSDQPAAGASVVLVPEGNRSAHTQYYRRSTTDQSGRFAISNVIPGDYKVFAFEELDRGASVNPDFLQPFEDRSQSVNLQEGGDLNVRLEIIPASEMSP
ncbi:MAG: carboxypeptidase regulatory-like domain-containing protein [Candidatus Sulfotelmatobacter sp.]